MAEVAKANDVPFVDCSTRRRTLYAKAAAAADDQRHPPERAGGNRPLAADHRQGPVRRARRTAADAERLEKLRQAVLDKNFYWFNRYRTVDGYSIYGGRADLKFVDGQTNRVVMQREMEVLDVMTANRDKRDLGRRPGRATSRSTTATRRRSSRSKTNKPGTGPERRRTSSSTARRRSRR